MRARSGIDGIGSHRYVTAMLTFVILSIFAAFMFHKATTEKGYSSPRFWMYPLIVGNGLMLFAMAVKWMTAEVFQGETTPFMKAYGPIVDVLALLVLIVIIAKAWKQIKSLPPRE